MAPSRTLRPAQKVALPPRGAAELMTPERLAALQPTRLSASRSLLDVMQREGWTIRSTIFDLDEVGNGFAVYEVATPKGIVSFVAFSSEPVLENRTPRIIGQSWDMVGALLEGPLDAERFAHTRRELPKLYAGRAASRTLVWCRANRSLRAFEHCVEQLANGHQPEVTELREIGYLLRNTGLDGNGTFGTRSFLAYGHDHPLAVPYHAQMLTAFMVRQFGFDLCDHLARSASANATQLAPALKRYLGLGNGSGLGLVLFAANHPRLVHRWIEIREQALAAARSLHLDPGDDAYRQLQSMLDRAIAYRREDPMEYRVFPSSQQVADELTWARQLVAELAADGTIDGVAPAEAPLEALRLRLRTNITPEAEEMVNAMLIELVPGKANALLTQLRVSERLVGNPAMTIGALLELIDNTYTWARDFPAAPPEQRDRVWYKSRAAEEPRSGPRDQVDGGFDLSVDLVGEVQELRDIAAHWGRHERVGSLLFAHPRLESTVYSLQALRNDEYALPRMDMCDRDFVPVHIIRLANSAFYGLDRTKDFMNRNLRGLIFQGAPTAADIGDAEADVWFHPTQP
jgi:hypothetical protein